jgi:hypothetical protein
LISSLFDLQDPAAIEAALRELRSFWKLWSDCLLRSSDLPTLKGVVVTGPHTELKGNLEKFLRSIGSKIVLVRHDKKTEAPPYPRGGFLVGDDLLEQTVRFFFKFARIVAIYEPADPLLNLHNMNLLFESDRQVSVEIVGPGFDASDLQRGDLSPHEAYSARLAQDGNVSELKLLQRIDTRAYRQSVVERKAKIKNKLETAPSVDLACRIRRSLTIPEDLNSHLRHIDSPLLKYDSYQPISKNLVRDTITQVLSSKVIERFKTLTGVGYPLVFSTSLVNRGQKQVFWDIVSPALKYQGLSTP